MITIEINDDEVSAALARALARLGDLTPFLQDAGEALVQSTRDRMLRGEQPDGASFAPRAPGTLARYQKTGQRHGPKPLDMEGHMRQGIHAGAGADYLEIGSNAVQAAVMHLGAPRHSLGPVSPWGDIPARPFLGLSEDDKTGLLADLADWLAEALEPGPAGGA